MHEQDRSGIANLVKNVARRSQARVINRMMRGIVERRVINRSKLHQVAHRQHPVADLEDIVALVKDVSSAPLRKGADAVRKARTLNDEATKKALAVLNRAQQKTWDEMTGEKFELKIDLLNRPGAKP